MTPAAFQAEFVNVKNVPSRKVLQVIFEVAVEESSKALDALGGIPHPGQSVRVAIARLDVAKVEKPAGKTPSQRAWALCQSGRFRQWISTPHAQCTTEENAAHWMRRRFGIKSRAEIDTNPAVKADFESLEREYQEASR